MGCGESKDSKGGQNGASAGSLIKNANKSKAPAHYPLLDTPEEQSARFLQLCNLPPEKPQELQQHQHGHAGNAASHHTNLLAVELHRVYTETRQRVFKQQQEDEEATAAQHEKEGEAHQQQQRMRDGPTTQAGTVNGMPTEKGATAAATKTEDGKHKASSSQEDSPILPPALQQPAQKEFSLCVNSSVEEAHRRHFTAFDVVEAVELFIGYVKHDLSAQQVNTQEKSSNPNNDHGLLNAAGGTETAAAAVTPSVPWTCYMRCTLSGDSGTAERLLAVAQQRWQEEREASHIKQSHGVTAAAVRHSNAHNSSNGGDSKSKKVLQVAPSTEPLANNSDASVAETGGDVKGGKCLLFIDAVFESAVPASFHRRTPWQLEIEVYFTA